MESSNSLIDEKQIYYTKLIVKFTTHDNVNILLHRYSNKLTNPMLF